MIIDDDDCGDEISYYISRLLEITSSLGCYATPVPHRNARLIDARLHDEFTMPSLPRLTAQSFL